jgi:hypothetical protein
MPPFELPPIPDELVELYADEDDEGVILVNEEINLMTLPPMDIHCPIKRLS